MPVPQADDALVNSVQAQVMTQLRPMVVALARKGHLDDRALDRIEAEARRLVHGASSGALRLEGISRDEPASRGYIVCHLLRVPLS